MTDELRAPALDPATVPGEERQPYPAPWDTALSGKFRKVLGDALGLTQIGVNLTRLAPGAVSALRHWHTGEDEFVFVVSGEPTLVCDSGEQRLAPGHVAGFPAGGGDGHRLENRTEDDVEFLEIGGVLGLREHREVARHEHGVERESAQAFVVPLGRERAVAGDADEPHQSSVACGHQGLECAAGSQCDLLLFGIDQVVQLDQVDLVDAQPV